MLRILRARLIALAAIAALAALIAACGGDDDDGGGTATPADDRFEPVKVMSVAPKLSDDQRYLWADIVFEPDGREASTVKCEATGPDGTARASLLSYAPLGPGESRHVIELGDAPDGAYTVRCASETAASAQIELARDPKKVVVREIEGRYELPDVRLDRDAPPVIEGTREEQITLTWFRDGFAWTFATQPPVRFEEVEAGVYQTEAKPFEELEETFTVRFEGDDLLLHVRAHWDNGRVDEYDVRWTRLPDATPTAVAPPVATATPAP